jgi:hypothetical protein
MSQLFEELVLPFVQSHGEACSVLLGGKQPEEMDEEAARELLWPVRVQDCSQVLFTRALMVKLFAGVYIKCSACIQ